MFQVKSKPIHPDYYKYPSSDGEPMAETTKHFRWIVTIKENLENITKGTDNFVAGDLLWYPVEGLYNLCKAPDVMVALGRPKEDKLSYLQWHENNVAPQVVFEIYSRSNHRRGNKENLLDFYEKYGVNEFYSYDPDSNSFVVYIRHGNTLTRLEDLPVWTSPLLQIRFERSERGFEIYRPDGQRFVNFQELEMQNKQIALQYEEERKLRRIERERMLKAENKAEVAEQKAEVAEQKAEVAEQKAEVAEQKAEVASQETGAARKEAETARREAETAHKEADAAKQRQKLLEEQLRRLGINPNDI